MIDEAEEINGKQYVTKIHYTDLWCKQHYEKCVKNFYLNMAFYLSLDKEKFDKKVTGIDLSAGMLEVLRKNYPHKELDLICDSYFDVPFGEGVFNAAVSVESLHHFTKEEKTPLYAKLYRSLKPGGYFILTDYFSLTDEEEQLHRQNLIALKKEQGLSHNEFYHYDTPLTVEHEKEALLAAGFTSVEVLKNWGATYTIEARK